MLMASIDRYRCRSISIMLSAILTNSDRSADEKRGRFPLSGARRSGRQHKRFDKGKRPLFCLCAQTTFGESIRRESSECILGVSDGLGRKAETHLLQPIEKFCVSRWAASSVLHYSRKRPDNVEQDVIATCRRDGFHSRLIEAIPLVLRPHIPIEHNYPNEIMVHLTGEGVRPTLPAFQQRLCFGLPTHEHLLSDLRR